MATNLPCPNTGIDAVRLPDGRLLIAFNDSTRTRYAARRKLMLAVSGNDGLTWRRVVVRCPPAIPPCCYPACSGADSPIRTLIITEHTGIQVHKVIRLRADSPITKDPLLL